MRRDRSIVRCSRALFTLREKFAISASLPRLYFAVARLTLCILGREDAMKLSAAVFLLIATCLPLAAVTTGNAPDQSAASPSKCAGLKNLTIANTEITSAIDVAAGSFKVPPQEKVSYPISLPAFCRVQGILRPTKDSVSDLKCGCQFQDGTVV